MAAADIRTQNRRSRKKRRTEVSSDESSDSSSSDTSSSDNSDHSDVETKDVEINNKEDTLMEDVVDTEDVNNNGDTAIDALQIEPSLQDKREVLKTRLKLQEVSAALAGTLNGSNSSILNNLPIDSDEWMSLMVSNYGDDIDGLRQAGDFKDGSVALVAELLRSSQNVFAPQ